MRHLDTVRIRALRGDESQERLAVRAGITRKTLARIESGRAARPLLLTMRALAEALGVTVEDITVDDSVSVPGATQRAS